MNSIRGFTFIEIIVVIAVVVALSVIAVVSLGAMGERLLLNSASSNIAFVLEGAKARSVAGTGALPHGVYFAEDGYVEFSGNSYDDEDEDNVTHELDPRLVLSTDIISGEESIVFSRITGVTDEAVVITISLVNDETKSRTVVVGAGGDIAYGD